MSFFQFYYTRIGTVLGALGGGCLAYDLAIKKVTYGIVDSTVDWDNPKVCSFVKNKTVEGVTIGAFCGVCPPLAPLSFWCLSWALFNTSGYQTVEK